MTLVQGRGIEQSVLHSFQEKMDYLTSVWSKCATFSGRGADSLGMEKTISAWIVGRWMDCLVLGKLLIIHTPAMLRERYDAIPPPSKKTTSPDDDDLIVQYTRKRVMLPRLILIDDEKAKRRVDICG